MRHEFSSLFAPAMLAKRSYRMPLSSAPNRENHKTVYFCPKAANASRHRQTASQSLSGIGKNRYQCGLTGFNRSGADVGYLRQSPADSGAKTLRHAVGINAEKSAA